MAKVIETNLSMKDNEIVGFQSRVIEVDSWNDYVNEVGNGDVVIRSSFIGNLHGISIPQGAKVENFYYDDKTLKCDIYNYRGVHSKKLAYLAEPKDEIKFKNGSTIKMIKSENSVRGHGWSNNEVNFRLEYESTFVGESEKE